MEAKPRVVCESGLQGVWAKRLRDPYRPRARGWIKTKNRQTHRFAEEFAGAETPQALRARVNGADRLGDWLVRRPSNPLRLPEAPDPAPGSVHARLTAAAAGGARAVSRLESADDPDVRAEAAADRPRPAGTRRVRDTRPAVGDVLRRHRYGPAVPGLRVLAAATGAVAPTSAPPTSASATGTTRVDQSYPATTGLGVTQAVSLAPAPGTAESGSRVVALLRRSSGWGPEARGAQLPPRSCESPLRRYTVATPMRLRGLTTHKNCA
jgi:hypothetical protein